ncbi:MAG: tetratricopeptide repeat protein, partial [Pyrinomonadaceae bacterium]
LHVTAGIVTGIVLLFIVAGSVAGFYYFYRSLFSGRTNTTDTTPASTPTPEATPLTGDLAQAESLISAGKASEAIPILKQILNSEPDNVEAHRQLGVAMLATNERPEAISEFKAASQINPFDVRIWRALGDAQTQEKQYSDAAESYRLLIEVSGEKADDQMRLNYADTLRLAGRNQEAENIYKKLVASNNPQVGQSSKQSLLALQKLKTLATPSPSPLLTETTPTPTPESVQLQSPPSVTPPPSPTLEPPRSVTADDHYRLGVGLWSSNHKAALQEFRAADRIPDSHYYLGLSYVEGREMRALARGELSVALGHFEKAASGPHAAEAKQYADRLGAEYERRAKNGVQ